nr:MAG TPA: hypothetical protein [Caudoviricetes sp.]
MALAILFIHLCDNPLCGLNVALLNENPHHRFLFRDSSHTTLQESDHPPSPPRGCCSPPLRAIIRTERRC